MPTTRPAPPPLRYATPATNARQPPPQPATPPLRWNSGAQTATQTKRQNQPAVAVPVGHAAAMRLARTPQGVEPSKDLTGQGLQARPTILGPGRIEARPCRSRSRWTGVSWRSACTRKPVTILSLDIPVHCRDNCRKPSLSLQALLLPFHVENAHDRPWHAS
jgi:hypothetical protein